MDVYQRRRLVALSAIAAFFIIVVLLIRSCGGDDTATPTTLAGASGASGVAGATSQSKDAYISQADPICLDANTQIAAVDTSQTDADAQLAQIVSGELQQLQSLTPPDDGTSDLNDYLSALQKQAKAYDEKATAIERGDTTTAAGIDDTLDQTASDAADAAQAFGFSVCGDTSKVSENGGGGGGGGSDTTSTDTGGTVTPTTPPATTTPVTPTPTPTPAPTPDTGTPPAPTDGGTGGTGSDSGGVSP
jgi:hypothetical protein